jgi:hypothetical protein
MPGFFVQAGATILCPHGGRVNVVPTQPRVRAGQPLGLLNGAYPIVGCPFMVPVGPAMKPQPCVRVQWLVPAVRVRVSGQPVLVRSSTGLCLSAEQIPQGAPIIVLTQFRAKGI